MVSAGPERQGLREVWWLHPAKLGLFFLIPLYTVIFLTPHIAGPGAVNIKFVVYFTWNYYWLGLAFLLVLTNGALIGSLDFRVRKPVPSLPPIFSRYYLDAIGLLVIFAYLVWYRNAFVHPSDILVGFKGRPGYTQIVGITTLTQLGVAYVILYLNQVWGARVPFESRRYLLYFCVIIAFTVLRVYAWAERLALIELMVPIALMYVVYKVPQARSTRIVAAALPLIGLGALFLFFGVTEYLRSWLAYYQYQGMPFWEFVERRLISYYYTALNNGAGMLTVYNWDSPSWKFNNVLSWLYRFPLLGRIVSYLMDLQPGRSFMERYADPEYNNVSGIFLVFLDMGLAGGLLVAALMGLGAGYFWRCFVQGRGPGVFYPIVFLALIEILRLFYIGMGRAFPALLALVLANVLFRRRPVVARELEGHASRARAGAMAL